jgi:CheY-like chemotaxis protein
MPTALLVDHDGDTREMFAECLRHLAYDVAEAADGREALAKALASPPDVIVTETRLPGLDGYALCRLLQRDGATSDIPVVVVTADAFPRDVRRAHAAGAVVVLTKPCSPDQLVTELERVLTRSRELRDDTARLQHKAQEQRARSAVLIDQSIERVSRLTLKRAHAREFTSSPPVSPPGLKCPTCGKPLNYQFSFVGGVSVKNPDQWDYLACTNGCGQFQYRPRTRKLRPVE